MNLDLFDQRGDAHAVEAICDGAVVLRGFASAGDWGLVRSGRATGTPECA